MRSGLLRALVTLAAFVAAWFVVSPAQAANASFGPMRFESTSAPLSEPFAPPFSMSVTPRLPESLPPSSRAPLCDPRGAITFAPPPQMQDLEVTLDTGLTLDDCLGGTTSERTGRAAPGRAPLPIDASSASTDAAVMTAAVALAAAVRELLPAPAARTTRARPGIRSTVDRPPRA